MSVVQRVHDLIRLAVDGGAALEESRTAAVAACRIIVRDGLQIIDRFAEPRVEPRVQYTRPPRERKTTPDARVIYSRYASPCRLCGELVAVGEPCWWRRGVGVVHVACQGRAAT